MTHDLDTTVRALLARGKGILAADETQGTLTTRFDALGILSTPTARRDYRELLFATPGIDEFVSGAILVDETIRQKTPSGAPLASLCIESGILPGIKVDTGAQPLARSPGERVTEGLDGLRERLAEYGSMGVRFAKWRAVFNATESTPTSRCIAVNALALGRYAALCQEQGLVPIVEPEVLAQDPISIERCEQVTGQVLHAVFAALFEQRVRLEGILLKPNMVLPGPSVSPAASVSEVATATLRCLRRQVPPAVPGIVFLSGGQNDVRATQHLDAMNRMPVSKPWTLTFSYGRALQDAALATWNGKPENAAAAQRAFYHRARCNSLAARGAYSDAEEKLKVSAALLLRRAAAADESASAEVE
jgi:fructose-bisphosphate aldolase class I